MIRELLATTAPLAELAGEAASIASTDILIVPGLRAEL